MDTKKSILVFIYLSVVSYLKIYSQEVILDYIKK